jgi:hypothetical protein
MRKIELYIIVHPKCVETIKFPDDASDARERLKKIMKTKPFLIIGDYENPGDLHPDLFPPCEGLEIKLAGAYLGVGTDNTQNSKWCINQQFNKLELRGYNVSIDDSASLKVY